MEKFKAIIFDMDGVLFDTETFYYRRREKFLADKGISIKHLPPSFFIGGNMKQIWRTFCVMIWTNGILISCKKSILFTKKCIRFHTKT